MTEAGRPIIMTGATGFLGSHLMAALLERGERLILLGRGTGSHGLRQRIDTLLTWFGQERHRSRTQTEEVDFLQPHLGLEKSRYQALCQGAGCIIHCASDTSFAERNRSRSLASNVTSLNSIVPFAADCRAATFHYISTAYSSGITTGTWYERPVSARQFFNVYEETKAMAERKVAESCTAHSIPFTIIRPSIVYGDSRTGRANRFTAIYHHVRALACIRDIYRDDILLHGGKKAEDQGIHLESDGLLHLPLRLILERQGMIDLIPVDYFVNAVLAIMEGEATDTIYHLTNENASSIEQLADYCERFLGIRGLKITYGPGREAQSPAEELFNRFIEPYRPYLADSRTFDRTNSKRILGNLQPPVFSYDIFRRCMAYATQVGWGQALYPQEVP